MSYDEHLISQAGGDGDKTDTLKAIDTLMDELVAREERWKKAWEVGELTHEEAVSATQEDRWVYSELAAIRFSLGES